MRTLCEHFISVMVWKRDWNLLNSEFCCDFGRNITYFFSCKTWFSLIVGKLYCIVLNFFIKLLAVKLNFLIWSWIVHFLGMTGWTVLLHEVSIIEKRERKWSIVSPNFHYKSICLRLTTFNVYGSFNIIREQIDDFQIIYFCTY